MAIQRVSRHRMLIDISCFQHVSNASDSMNQVRLSVGATWVKSQKTTLGGAITYADLGDGAIDNGGTRPISGAPWQVVGDYGTNEVIFAAFNVGWK